MSDDTKFEFEDLDFGEDADVVLPPDPAFDAWIATAAASLTEPDATPREDMWNVIAARTAAANGNVAGVLTLVPAKRRAREWMWPAAVAAALLIGIGVDRLLVGDSAGAVRGTPTPRVASTEQASRSGKSEQDPAVAISESVGEPVRVARGGERTSSSAATATHGAATREALRGGTAEAAPSPSRSATPPASRSTSLYRLAAVQTLSQAEALLVAYRSSGVAERDPAAAKQLGNWGREVLSSTRLLLDSPAGDDPTMRPLLNDLELVLVQIIRLSGAPLSDSERALIDRSLRERDLLPRIRTAVPAGATGATSDE